MLFACVSLLFVLSGCKYTDVLTEHIEDPAAAVDPNAEPMYQSNPDAEKIEGLVDMTVDEVDDINDQVEMLPHYDPNAPDNGPTHQRVETEDIPQQEEASQGDLEDVEQTTDQSGQNSEGEGGGESDSQQEQDENEGVDEGDGENLESDEVEEPQPDQSETGGAGGTEIIVDDEGVNDDEMQKGSVAAVGEYATITQMLGGAGSLVATDQNWIDTLPDGVFPNELDNVSVAWSGDGTAAGSTKMDALIDEIKPAVVLWDGVEPALSESERSKLEDAGITVMKVPRIGQANTEDNDVMQAVTEVASVLAGSTTLQYDPIAMRDAYLQFHNAVLKASYDANGGAYAVKVGDVQNPHLYQDTPISGGFDKASKDRVTTVYIDDLWHPGAKSATISAQIGTSDGSVEAANNGKKVDVTDGVGLSVATSTDSYVVLDYYLQFAGIVNNAYDSAKPEPIGRRYIIMAGSTADFGTTGAYASRTGVDSALWYNVGDYTVASNWRTLGNADFPGVLVNGEADADIAAALVASNAKSNGLYNMDSSYGIYVVPSGVSGNWAYGNVESFLVSLWSLRLRDASVLESAGDAVGNFYEAFYRCTRWSSAVENWDSAYTAK